MAGAGFKTFAASSVLTSTDVNTYLMQQAVMVFASAAARTSAVTAPSEGMVSYRTDANIVEVYDGANWKQMGGTTGGILQVVEGTSTTTTTTTSTSFVSSGLSASITPKSSSSKILVLTTQACGNSTSNTTGTWTLYRGTTSGTNIGNGTNGITQLYTASGNNTITSLTMMKLDSPATTSSQTYTSAFRVSFGSTTLTSQISSSQSSMVLIEVAG